MPERVVGIDFGGPSGAAAQRRKIVLVAATRVGRGRWEIRRDGPNARLLGDPPGFTAGELADALVAPPCPSVVAADFPFSLPLALLRDDAFARLAGRPAAFGTWAAFNRAVAAALPLSCPVDYAPFAGWRERRFWLRRATDVACRAQPALKDRFQALFNMTLLGNALLARLARSGRFDVVPFHARGRAAVVEVYPGHLLRCAGLARYKRAPAEAIEAAVGLLRERGLSLAVEPAVRAACLAYDTGGGRGHDHDLADALVAACVAILYRERKARAVGGSPEGAGRHEGAIWSV